MQPDLREVDRIVSEALNEDLGRGGDITSRIVIPEDAEASFAINAREPLVACGLFVAKRVFDYFDPHVTIDFSVEEGQVVQAGDVLLKGSGNVQAIFGAERVALNLLRQMCGVATSTRFFVDKTMGSNAHILDTRKTTPGLRVLQKYAVTVGGGYNHRFRLDDGILIKDNHISVCGSVAKAVKLAKENAPSLTKVEVECDTIDQVKEAIEAGADIIMLDNMSIEDIEQAVVLAKDNILLEASGNVSLDTVERIAQTGVAFISVGSITNHPTSVDIGLDMIAE